MEQPTRLNLNLFSIIMANVQDARSRRPFGEVRKYGIFIKGAFQSLAPVFSKLF
jgi:hypothetical protein